MAAAILAVFGTACSGAPSAPRSDTIRVTVQTSSGDADFDGYDVVVDPARRLTADAWRRVPRPLRHAAGGPFDALIVVIRTDRRESLWAYAGVPHHGVLSAAPVNSRTYSSY
jgi:hypothetical protein